MMSSKISVDERLNKYMVILPNGCWQWIGSLNKDGYGKMGFRINGVYVTKRAHIVSYEHFRGPVPDGCELDHECRFRPCINPAHLEPVTHLENMRRGVHAMKTECVRGHTFTPENTYVNPNLPNSRYCRECKSLRDENRSR